MSNVTIEEIKGKQCTVIRKPFDAEWVKDQLEMGVPVVVERHDSKIKDILIKDDSSVRLLKQAYGISAIITILPPLPKHPRPEDEGLFYQYMTHGIHIQIEVGAESNRFWLSSDTSCLQEVIYKENPVIIQCTLDDEIVEVAIND